jgi:CRISPR-associated protein Cas6
MNTVDLLFPVIGRRIRTDHNYPLYSALSRLLPCLHDGSLKYALGPISGVYVGEGFLQCDLANSHLRLRVRAEDIPRVLPLAGKSLTIMGQRLCLGVPQVWVLKPAPVLFARLVTFKNATDHDTFLAVARRELDQLGIGGELSVPEHWDKKPERGPYRRVMRIKDTRIVCFPLLVRGLQPDESLKLQETGLGGRRHMGAGFFVPANDGED